jgi:hypothetical protein
MTKKAIQQKQKQNTFPEGKNKDDPTNEQRYFIRGQGRPQPEQARRRILVLPLRQA